MLFLHDLLKTTFHQGTAFCGILKSSSILVPMSHLSFFIFYFCSGSFSQKLVPESQTNSCPHEMENMSEGRSLLALWLSRFLWVITFDWCTKFLNTRMRIGLLDSKTIHHKVAALKASLHGGQQEEKNVNQSSTIHLIRTTQLFLPVCFFITTGHQVLLSSSFYCRALVRLPYMRS